MLDLVLTAAAFVVFIVAVFLRHIHQWSLSPPLLGLAAGVVLGPEVLNALVIGADQQADIMETAARLLMAVALMAVALRYPLDQIRAKARDVAIMLGVVLPVMVAVTATGAMGTLGVPLGLALVLGASLSPTDPVLATGVVTGDAAERDIPTRDRQVLGFESGINDGLVLPLIVVVVAIPLQRSMAGEVGLAIYKILAGLAIGAVVGYLAGRALRTAEDHREIGPAVASLYTLVLAFGVLGLSALLQADDLLSVFVAGLMHNKVVSSEDREAEFEIDETLNEFLVVPVFLLLGVALPWAAWGELGWGAIVFLLVVFGLRRLPIVLALKRPLRADWPYAIWLGWFSPLGVGTLYYLSYSHLEGVTDPVVWTVGSLVIATSTVIHSLTAAPARALRRRYSS